MWSAVRTPRDYSESSEKGEWWPIEIATPLNLKVWPLKKNYLCTEDVDVVFTYHEIPLDSTITFVSVAILLALYIVVPIDVPIDVHIALPTLLTIMNNSAIEKVQMMSSVYILKGIEL